MNYRVTILTPTLVGSGDRLSPVDYMVWKDHVNVLDQYRIFKLLSKGPRLDGYLNQLHKAEKLDFASWGGFAQNYAGRRIPLESALLTPVWERARAEHCHIPEFTAGPQGRYLPATAIKGALRTALLHSLWKNKLDDRHERFSKILAGDRIPRRLAADSEEQTLGAGGNDRMRKFAVSDSAPLPDSAFKVYLLRTAALTASPKGGGFDLGWKGMGRALDDRRREESTPYFAEMATPGSAFTGKWNGEGFPDLLAAANAWSGQLLDIQRGFAERAKLAALTSTLGQLREHLDAARASRSACLLTLGWGGGLLSKSATLDTESEAARKVFRALPYYSRAIQTGLPFPKTRKVLFAGGHPVALPGWALLQVLG
jgi:CRISPR-associated protein Csm5